MMDSPSQSLHLFPAPLFYAFPRDANAQSLRPTKNDVVIINIAGDSDNGFANYAKVVRFSSLDPIVARALRCVYRNSRGPVENQHTMLASLVLSSVLSEEVPFCRFAHELCMADSAASHDADEEEEDGFGDADETIARPVKPARKRTLRNRLFRSRMRVMKKKIGPFVQRIEMFGVASTKKDLVVRPEALQDPNEADDPQDSQDIEEGEIISDDPSPAVASSSSATVAAASANRAYVLLDLSASQPAATAVATAVATPVIVRDGSAAPAPAASLSSFFASVAESLQATHSSASRPGYRVERDPEYLRACVDVIANRHYNDNLALYHKRFAARGDFPEMYRAQATKHTSLSDFSDPLWMRSLLVHRIVPPDTPLSSSVNWAEFDPILAAHAMSLAIACLEPLRGFRSWARAEPAFTSLAEHPLLPEATALAQGADGHARVLLLPIQVRRLDLARKARWFLCPTDRKSDGSSPADGGPVLVDEAFRSVVADAEAAMALQDNLALLKEYLGETAAAPPAEPMSTRAAPKEKADEFLRLFDPSMLPWLDALF